MTTTGWILLGVGILAAIGLAIFIVSRTRWWQIRKYALDLKRVYDRHNLQDKMQALQQLQAAGVNDPTRAKKPLRDVVEAYRGLIGDLEKLKAPGHVTELHEETLSLHREAQQFYQIVSTGTFRQKEMVKRQAKLQQMERTLQTKMEAMYGKPK